MRILLAQRLPALPALCGETKCNLGLLEAFAQANHSCRMVALARQTEEPDALEQLQIELAAQGITRASSSADVDVYVQRGVEIHVVPDGYRLWTHLAEQIHSFHPTWVFISGDRTFLGLATALDEAGPERVVYVAHSQATLPFGPECFSPDPAKAMVLKRAAGIVASSRYIGDYIRRSSGLEATVLPFPAYGAGPFPNLGRPDKGYVTLVNPSQLKGIAIFEQLAAARPDIEFAAVPTWATTGTDLERLRRLPNVRVLSPEENIDKILSRTRVLLAPSLWGEGFGLIVVEAMVRGIPVLASNIGGLPEAKLGIDYLLPVRPIQHYSEQTDDRGLPIPIVAPQDVGPWLDALDRLLSEQQHYKDLSAASRAAALDHVARSSIDPFEEYLERLATAPPEVVHPQSETRRSDEPISATASLSPERLELLAALLKENQ